MKKLRIVLILALLMIGVIASALPSLAASQNPGNSEHAPAFDNVPLPKFTPILPYLDDPSDCSGC